MVRVHLPKTVKSIEGLKVGPSDRSQRQVVWFSLPDFLETNTSGYRLSLGLPARQNSEGNISYSLLRLSADPGEKPRAAYLGEPPKLEWERPATNDLLRSLNNWLLAQEVSEEAAGELVVQAGEQLNDLALVFSSDLLDSVLDQIYFEPVRV